MIKGGGKGRRKKRGQDEAEIVEQPKQSEQPEQAEPQTQAVVGTELQAAVQVVDEANGTQKTEAESTHEKYERVKKGQLYLTDLQRIPILTTIPL